MRLALEGAMNTGKISQCGKFTERDFSFLAMSLIRAKWKKINIGEVLSLKRL